MKHLTIDPNHPQPATRDLPAGATVPDTLPDPKETKVHPTDAGGENARLLFVGTATTILEWEGIRLMTDPNFLHAGDHVHLGPGVTGTRRTNPAVDLHDLPPIDLICLSHYHADHFDQLVEASLRRDLPILTTPHAKSHLASPSPTRPDPFTAIHDLDVFDACHVAIAHSTAAIRVTAMPGKHVPPGPANVFGKLNDLLGAVPPTNGWMLELGHSPPPPKSQSPQPPQPNPFNPTYRIYITGDTLLIPDLADIPTRYPTIDLLLIHLGGTSVPSPHAPLRVMVTMDAEQGVQLVRTVAPRVTVPVHYDDYDVFSSPLSDFRRAMEEAGFGDKVVYLDRKDAYRFRV